VKYDLKNRASYEDGWIIIGPNGEPVTGKWYYSRDPARFDRREFGPAAKHLRVVKARRILAWKKP